MAETSLSKLQNRVTKLEKENAKLRDLLEERRNNIMQKKHCYTAKKIQKKQ